MINGNDAPMRRFVSVHFPKAGGTSLVNQMRAKLGDRILLDYDHDPVVSSEAATIKADPLPPHFMGVHGHFRPSRYIKSEDCAFITYLREPVDNIVSIYFYWKQIEKHGNPVHDRFLDEKWSILDLAQTPEFRCLMSSTYFSSFDMGRFDFIGFLDKISADMALLSEILGIDLDASVHLNKTMDRADSSREELLSDRQVINLLRNLLKDDIRFYERLRYLR